MNHVCSNGKNRLHKIVFYWYESLNGYCLPRTQVIILIFIPCCDPMIHFCCFPNLLLSFFFCITDSEKIDQLQKIKYDSKRKKECQSTSQSSITTSLVCDVNYPPNKKSFYCNKCYCWKCKWCVIHNFLESYILYATLIENIYKKEVSCSPNSF